MGHQNIKFKMMVSKIDRMMDMMMLPIQDMRIEIPPFEL